MTPYELWDGDLCVLDEIRDRRTALMKKSKYDSIAEWVRGGVPDTRILWRDPKAKHIVILGVD